MEIEMENGPKLDRGKNGQKMAQKWILREFSIIFPFLGHFFAIFAPVQLGAVFHFDFHFFFSISGFWPFSMPYQPGLPMGGPPSPGGPPGRSAWSAQSVWSAQSGQQLFSFQSPAVH